MDSIAEVDIAEELATQIAAVAAKNHQHSVHNPLSQYRRPYSIEEVLAAGGIGLPETPPDAVLPAIPTPEGIGDAGHRNE